MFSFFWFDFIISLVLKKWVEFNINMDIIWNGNYLIKEMGWGNGVLLIFLKVCKYVDKSFLFK